MRSIGKPIGKMLTCSLLCLTMVLSFVPLGFGQAVTTSRMVGTVTDAQGAVISKAEIVVKNPDTKAEYKAVSNDRGEWTIPTLPSGTYEITITAPNFKTTVVKGVKVDVGSASTVNSTLEVGQVADQIVVTGGAEIVQTQSANVANTITGRQINELPFVARDAVQLVLSQPGVSTPGTPRTSSIDGLPKGSINMTLNGLNIQDNLLKSSDGFFAVVQPKADAVEEVTISTATPGAESGGEGAVQVKFITKSGTNAMHGGAFWQHRNTALNSNYFFNNLSGLSREKIILNQYGGHAGGPILKDKLFYFVNYEGFRLPQTFSRVGLFNAPETILSPSALGGIFTYKDSTGAIQQINLYNLAATKGFTNTPDPLLQGVLTKINQLSNAGGKVTDRIASNNDFNRMNLDFLAPAMNKREFLTSHIDYNITSKHHFDLVYDYQYYDSSPDNVNLQFQSYPGTGTVFGHDTLGSVHRNTFAAVGALRSNLTPNLINEFRYGLSGGGTTQFGKEITPNLFDQLGGNALTFGFITSPQNRSSFSARNTPVWQLFDNVYWVRGQHAFAFGMQYTRVDSWQKSFGRQEIPLVTFGVASTDPVITGSNAIFTAGNFPNSTSTDRNNAAALYALLTGRVSAISRSVSLDETTKNYAFDALQERNRQVEYGFYGSDSYRVRSNLTVNYGLRWQIEPSPRNLNSVYTKNSLADIFGVSGVGNLFKPGTFTGSQPAYVPQTPDDKAYATKFGEFAPSFGLAYSIDGKKWGGPLAKIFGGEGQTVIRGGYSIAYVREGLNTFLSISGANQGPTVSLAVDPGNFPSLFPPGSVLYRNPGSFPSRPAPTSLAQSLLATPGVGVNAFDPNLTPGYVQSWTFGVQRELNKDMALEIRYVGNHGTKLWRQIELNQVNISTNGFLNEFKNAQSNQAICLANSAACIANQTTAGVSASSRTASAYGNFGLPGQVNVSIIQTAIGSGVDSATITSIQRGEAARVAQTIAFNTTRMANLINAGLVPFVTQTDGLKVSNFFIANPSIFGGGAFLVTNGTNTAYNSLQIELRRRMAKGLLVQASYTLAKAFSDTYNSSSAVFSEPVDIRNPGAFRTFSPWDLRHAFKVDWLYELPTGNGHRLGFDGNNSTGKAVNSVIGNWQFNGVVRIQSGTPFLLTGGRETATANDLQSASADNGVILHGLTVSQLQSMVSIRHVGNQIFWLPPDLVANSQAAFETGGLTLAQLNPNAPYIGPPTTPGEFGQRIVLHGPSFTRFDLGIMKRIKVTETKEFQFRVTMLNAFNNINFFITPPGNDSSTFALTSSNPPFGTTVSAYRDSSVSGTNDPGGRLIEFQLRFNF